jgi:signal transduction histidine kinase
MSRLRARKVASKGLAGEGQRTLERISPEVEADLLRRLWNFHAQLRDVGEVEKVLPLALRLAMDFFHVPNGCVTEVRPGFETADIHFPIPAGSTWDRTLFADFLRGRKVTVPPELMLARLRRFGRMWGALVVSSPGADFRWDARQAFSTIGSAVTQLIDRIDAERIREVRARIDHKVLEQIGPKDLFYQILHGIRSLVGYDHSAALLTCDEERTSLEVVGEQIAWCKAKSQKIGLKLPLGKPLLELLARNTVLGFHRDGSGWADWTASGASAVADLLDYNRESTLRPGLTAEGAMLCAPLVTKHGVLGLLKVASVRSGSFGPYEAEIISQFLPHAAVALQNMRRTESLKLRVHAAERKQAMADLARGVSHDVNNALGAVLPLVQELRVELDEGTFRPETAAEDLREIERSLQVCRRIFNGMLAFARSGARNASEVFLHHEIDCTLAIFKEGLERRGIEVCVEVPGDLPPLVGIQADVEQLLINLISNARDSMDSGGRLTLRAVRDGNRLELTVEDTGCGIPEEHMPKVQEPFFTTKAQGNGLGLSICRSIVSQMRGKMTISSAAGRGTTVKVVLPLVEEPGT